MGFSQKYVIDANIITDGIYKLSFICELGYYIECMNNNNKYGVKIIEDEEIYKYLYRMIRFCISEVFELEPHKLNHKEFYLMSLLKNVLVSDVNQPKNVIKDGTKIKIEKDKKIDIISVAYYLTLEIIKKDKNISIFELQSLITQTQNLDLSILTPLQIKSILEVLNVKRKIFVRIILILSHEMIKYKYTKPKIIKTVKFNERKEMVECLSKSVIETVIYLTACKINNGSYNF